MGRPVRLSVVLAATLFSLAGGYLLKLPCLTGPWDGRQYNRLCYSDLAALYNSTDRDRGLAADRVPYFDAENEYPVLSGLTMYAAALPASSYPSFVNWNVALLTAAALATAWALHRMAGGRALLFALAPTLAIYGFMNWDLIAVALATLATLAHLRRRDALAGVLIGLGAAAKLYPALLLIPFVLDRVRDGKGRDGVRQIGAAAAAWLAVNVPFAVVAPDRWSEFFRFNAARPADWDTVWFALQEPLGISTPTINVLSLIAFAVAGTALWFAARRLRPGISAWTFGFPLLVAFLLTNKVFSPQYGLWLLPWFALTLPDLRLFAWFQAADVAVFVTRFQWFARYLDVGTGVPLGAFQVALVVRAAIVIVCVAAWLVRRTEGTRPAPEPVPEAA